MEAKLLAKLARSAITTAPVAGRRMSGWRGRARTVGLWFLALTVAAASMTLAAGQVAKARARAQHRPLGELVDIGGYRLHLYCQGSGGPTVILEAGGGETLLDWALTQPEIAKQARVCAYDRAGLGWSDPSPRPRTAAVMAEELHTLLHRAGIEGPYVLVGHSLGGPIVRQFALAHPQDVAGMVLVDSSTEQQSARFPEAYRAAMAGMPRMLRLASLAADAGLLALFPGVVPQSTQLPPDAAATIQALAISSGKMLRATRAELMDAEADPTPRPATLGGMPLVVLRRDPNAVPVPSQIAPEVAQQFEVTWAQMQEELAALSPRGRVILAEGSGHGVMLDRPDLVIRAIRDVLAATM
ncbi:MAG: alpha/beta hydrolase [Chloroflexales bacterium]|nr:alpha/beta hydrolase [Chloroflexales bacterium]